MYRKQRKFTPLEAAILDYLTFEQDFTGRTLGQLIDHFPDRNPAYLLDIFYLLKKEGWVIEASQLKHIYRKSDLSLTPSYEWRIDPPGWVNEIVGEHPHDRLTLSTNNERNFLKTLAQFRTYVTTFSSPDPKNRLRIPFTLGDERAIIALYEECVGPIGGQVNANTTK